MGFQRWGADSGLVEGIPIQVLKRLFSGGAGIKRSKGISSPAGRAELVPRSMPPGPWTAAGGTGWCMWVRMGVSPHLGWRSLPPCSLPEH